MSVLLPDICPRALHHPPDSLLRDFCPTFPLQCVLPAAVRTGYLIPAPESPFSILPPHHMDLPKSTYHEWFTTLGGMKVLELHKFEKQWVQPFYFWMSSQKLYILISFLNHKKGNTLGNLLADSTEQFIRLVFLVKLV